MKTETSQTKTAPSAAEIQTWLVDYLAEALEIDAKEIDPEVPFQDYGLDSSAAVTLTGDLGEWLDRELDPTLLVDYITIKQLSEYLGSTEEMVL